MTEINGASEHPGWACYKGDPPQFSMRGYGYITEQKSDRKSDNDKDLKPVSGPEKNAHVIIR